jgi:hypothetical protein
VIGVMRMTKIGEMAFCLCAVDAVAWRRIRWVNRCERGRWKIEGKKECKYKSKHWRCLFLCLG